MMQISVKQKSDRGYSEGGSGYQERQFRDGGFCGFAGGQCSDHRAQGMGSDGCILENKVETESENQGRI